MPLATVPNAISQAQLYLRPLGSFEDLLWQMDKRSPLHATLAAHVDGITTIDEWRRAFEETRQRHPLWSAVIAQTDGAAPYFQAIREPGLMLRIVEGNFTSGWEHEVARELSLPIDAQNGPLVRAVLMHTDASSMLILSAHHSICDGMSLAFAVRDMLQALSGLKLKKLSLHSSQEESLGVFPERRAPRSISGQRTEMLTRGTVYRTKSSIVPEVRSLQFSCGLTDALQKRARQEKTTVHAALLAATGMTARRNPGYASGRDLHLCSTISNARSWPRLKTAACFLRLATFPSRIALPTTYGISREDRRRRFVLGKVWME